MDGYLGPDPFNQRAVYENAGFIFKLSKDIWDRHPCCAFTVTKEFATTYPNTFLAMWRAIVDATHYASDPAHRKEIAAAIAPTNYLNQPVIVLEQVLTGTYADGLGNIKKEPNRIDFDPYPWHSMAIWILTQMKRWGHLKGDVNYKIGGRASVPGGGLRPHRQGAGVSRRINRRRPSTSSWGRNLIPTTPMPMRRVSKFTAWPKEKRWNR